MPSKKFLVKVSGKLINTNIYLQFHTPSLLYRYLSILTMCVYIYKPVCIHIYTYTYVYAVLLCIYCVGISHLAACRIPLLHKLGWGKSYAGDFLKQNRRFASISLICCVFPLASAVKRLTALIPSRSGFFLCFVEEVSVTQPG